MPRTLKLLLLASALAAPLCANAAARPVRQTPAVTQQPLADDFERGKQMLAQGDVRGATAAFKRAAEQRKTDAEVWYSLGLALGREHNPKDARKAFERALKLRPDWADAHAGLAFSLLTLGKGRDAEKSARRALASDPQHGQAHYVIAYLRLNEEKYPEALAESEAALRDRPEFAAAAHLVADSLLGLYFEESVRQYRKYPHVREAPEAERKAAQEMRERALAPLKGRMREVAEQLEKFVTTWPDAPEVESWRVQAETLRIYGRPPGAPALGDAMPSDQLTTRALITFKPEPGYTQEARMNNVTGRVRLRAILGADGTVRNIVAMSRLSGGLTERAIEAARRIRFTPASLDGRPVSQFVVLEYNFDIH